MRYSELFEDDSIRIDPAMFRVTDDDKKFITFVKSEDPDFDANLWAVCRLRREPTTAIVLGVNSGKKLLKAHLVRSAPAWRMSPVEKLSQALEYVQSCGYGMLARHLTDVGIRLLSESINTDLSEGTQMRFTEIMESSLNEAKRFDWHILPATMALYGKRVVDIITAASTWDECTILVCEKDENGRKRLAFVSSASPAESYNSYVGKTFHAGHDQTQADKGFYKVVNVVHVKDGQIVGKVNDIGVNSKASLAVFK